MKIATKLKSLIVSLGLMAGGVYAAGIPVIDGTSKIQNAQEIMAMVKEYERTAERWIEELNNFESQMGNISGVRELGDLVNTAQRLRQQMERLKGKYDALKNLAENPLEGAAAALMESLRVYDNCGILKDQKLKNICYYGFRSQVLELSEYDEKMDELQNLTATINTLDGKIANSTDQKQSLDNIAAATKLAAELEAKRQTHELTKEAAERRRETNAVVQEQMRAKALNTPVTGFTINYVPIGGRR